MWACSFYRMDIVRYLLSTGKCEVNAVDGKKSSALIYATNSTVQLSKEMIQTLIEYGADVNHHDNEGATVLNTLISSSSESNLTGLCEFEEQQIKAKFFIINKCKSFSCRLRISLPTN